MTPSDISRLMAAIQRTGKDASGRPVAEGIFPRIRWSSDEISVFTEGLANIDIDCEQAIAAVRNLKRTCDKYPTIAAVTKALKAAEAKPARTAEASTVASTSERLARMRRRLDWSHASARDVVEAYWRRFGFPGSVDLRGYVTRDHVTQMADDLFLLAQVPEDLAAGMAMEAAAEFPSEPPADYPATPMQAWYVQMVTNEATDPKPEAQVVRSILSTEAFPTKREKARKAFERMKEMGRLAMLERGGRKVVQGISAEPASIGGGNRRNGGGE